MGIMNKYFSPNGRIIESPFRTEHNTLNNEQVIINFYKIKNLYTYSIHS